MTHHHEMSRNAPGIGVGVADSDSNAYAGSVSVRPISDRIICSDKIVDLNNLEEDFEGVIIDDEVDDKCFVIGIDECDYGGVVYGVEDEIMDDVHVKIQKGSYEPF